MATEQPFVRFEPAHLFTPEFTAQLEGHSRSMQHLMTNIANIPSVGSVVARKDAVGSYFLKANLRESRNSFTLFDVSKNRWNMKFKHETFGTITDFDRICFYSKLYTINPKWGSRKGCIFKMGVSQQVPLVTPLDNLRMFVWSGFHESYGRTRLGLKAGLGFQGLKVYLFRESKKHYEFGPNPDTNSLRVKFKYDLTPFLRHHIKYIVNGGVKVVHPFFGLSTDNEWHICYAQLQRFRTNWLFSGSVLELQSYLNMSNKYTHFLYQMRGVDGTQVVGDESHRFNVQSVFNFKLKRDPARQQPRSLNWFGYASFFLRDYSLAKAAFGAGIEFLISEHTNLELMLNYIDWEFTLRISRD